MFIKFAKLAYILIQIVQTLVIFNHLKLWVEQWDTTSIGLKF